MKPKPGSIIAPLLTILLCLSLSGCGVGPDNFSMKPIATYNTGVIADGAAEISAYDPGSQRLFVLRADEKAFVILDIRDPSAIREIIRIPLGEYGAGPNSIAAMHGLIAIAVEAYPKQYPGAVVIFDINGDFLAQYQTGSLPDMVTFTPDGSKILTANEGEPDIFYARDPEGSVTIVDISNGAGAGTVTQVGFSDFNEADLEGVYISGPNATVAQDLEPEYIAVSSDSKTAYVSLQENNALAVVDIPSGQVEKIVGLGYKDHSLAQNALDVSDTDREVNLQTYPVLGLYQPDALAAFTANDKTFILSANEGDSRVYRGFRDESRVQKLKLDPAFYDQTTADALQRLKVSTTMGDIDGDGWFEQLYSFGGRSFSIWDSDGEPVWDSGSQFADYFAENHPRLFNSQGTYETFDDRSDDKGSEPEAIASGVVRNWFRKTTYAFIGLERTGGIMVYDVSDPAAPEFVGWFHNTVFDGRVEKGTAGDISPEGLVFVPAADSPTRKPLLIVSHEISGTVTIFEIDP